MRWWTHYYVHYATYWADLGAQKLRDQLHSPSSMNGLKPPATYRLTGSMGENNQSKLRNNRLKLRNHRSIVLDFRIVNQVDCFRRIYALFLKLVKKNRKSELNYRLDLIKDTRILADYAPKSSRTLLSRDKFFKYLVTFFPFFFYFGSALMPALYISQGFETVTR